MWSGTLSDEEIVEYLLKFKEHLPLGTIFMDLVRSLGWGIVTFLGWIVDGLDGITDEVLGLKTFFKSEGMTELMDMLLPVSITILAFSILYTGYLLIFQRKFNREAIVINVILFLSVLTILGTGMEKANDITDKAIEVLKEDDDGLGKKIIKDHVLETALFDLNGWEKPDIDPKNNVPEKAIMDIDINTPLTPDSKINNKSVSDMGKEILNFKVDTLSDGKYGKTELDEGDFITKITKEYYYRYDVEWTNLLVTLGVMAFTLLIIGVKVVRLLFELAINYVLASIIAPADIHSGQKIKQVLQNIINTFVAMIMIFLSLKVYMLFTSLASDKLDGIAYLVAMIGLSVAVIDGPNVVERLFGIDIGLKSSWGVLAGGYAATKGLSGALGGIGKGMKAGGSALVSGGAGAAGMTAGMMKGMGNKQDKESDKNNAQGKGLQKGNGDQKGTQEKDQNGNGKDTAENQAAAGVDRDQANSSGSDQTTTHAAVGGLHQEMASRNASANGSTGQFKFGLHQEMGNRNGSVSATNQQGSNGTSMTGGSGVTSTSGTSGVATGNVTGNATGLSSDSQRIMNAGDKAAAARNAAGTTPNVNKAMNASGISTGVSGAGNVAGAATSVVGTAASTNAAMHAAGTTAGIKGAMGAAKMASNVGASQATQSISGAANVAGAATSVAGTAASTNAAMHAAGTTAGINGATGAAKVASNVAGSTGASPSTASVSGGGASSNSSGGYVSNGSGILVPPSVSSGQNVQKQGVTHATPTPATTSGGSTPISGVSTGGYTPTGSGILVPNNNTQAPSAPAPSAPAPSAPAPSAPAPSAPAPSAPAPSAPAPSAPAPSAPAPSAPAPSAPAPSAPAPSAPAPSAPAPSAPAPSAPAPSAPAPSAPEQKASTTETRHVGNVLSDKFSNNSTIRKVQQSYRIGQNTGSSLKKNIFNFRKKHR